MSVSTEGITSRLPLYFVVAATAAAVLGLELVQTRVLSALYYNHVVYMTVTIALMGFGISGTLVSVLAKRIPRPEAMAAYAILGLAVSSFLCLRLASFVPALLPQSPLNLKLPLSYLILVVPFLCGGTALGLLFMSHGRNIFRLYCADLVASAGAVLAFGLLLRPLGADGFIWLSSGLALTAFLVEGWRMQLAKRGLAAGAVLCLAGFAAFGTDLVSDQPEHYKTSGKVYQDHWTSERFEATEWTAIAKIDVLSDSARDLVSQQLRPDAAAVKMIVQDGDAFTIMLGEKPVTERLAKAKAGGLIGSLGLTYQLRPAPPEALVIGVGGGIDIVTARAYGAQHITGVEINPATVDLMTGPYADYALWPKWDNVDIHRSEGRHYVRHSKQRFDTIVMSGIDTFSALNSGAYVLAENYLYTTEAMQDYLGALKDDGVLSIFRWLFSRPRESLRLANLYLAAAERMGLERPEASIVVVAEDFGWSWRWASTIVKKTPFTPEEVRMIVEKVAREPSLAMVYVPKVFAAEEQAAVERATFRDDAYLQPTRQAYAALLGAKTAADRAAFERDYEFRVDPVSDDRPFFFEYDKSGTFRYGLKSLSWIRGTGALYSLYYLLFMTTVISAVGMLLPLWRFERDGLKVNRAGSLIGFFASLGIGFMLIEIGFMQWLNLYLGDPMYSLMVVLAGLLLFTGFGSLLAGQLQLSVPRAIACGMLGVAGIVPLWLLVMNVVLPATGDLDLPARCAIALASLLPVGLLMGIPFATGLRYLAEDHQSFVPWAWGINGLTSVMASILAVILAMRFGFTAVILIGAGIYAAGYVGMRWHLRRAGDAAQGEARERFAA